MSTCCSLRYIFLWVLLVGSWPLNPLMAQHKIQFRYKVNTDIVDILSRVLSIRVDDYIVYEERGLGQNEPRDFEGKDLDVISFGTAWLRLVFSPGEDDQELLDRHDLVVQVSAEGALKTEGSPYKLTMGRSRKNYIDLPIKDEGLGKVTLKIIGTDLGEGKVSTQDQYNHLILSYDAMIFQRIERRISFLDASQVADKIPLMGLLHDRFHQFALASYRKVKEVDLVRQELLDIRQEIDALHKQYYGRATAAGASVDDLIKYHQLFKPGQGKLLDDYRSKAEQALVEFDNNLWESLKNEDLKGLESYQMSFDRFPGYQPRHVAEVKRAMSRQVDESIKKATDCDAVRTLLTSLESSRYYEQNSNDPRFEALRQRRKECGGPSCEELFELAINKKTRQACRNFLNECQSKASASQIAKIEGILESFRECDRCRSDYLLIQKDTLNLADYTAVIQALLSDCESCLNEAQWTQLREWQSQTAPLVLRENRGPELAPEGEQYFFTLTFASGKGIEPYRLDGNADTLFLQTAFQESLRWEWLFEDSVLRLSVLDATPHSLVLKARSGDTLALTLKRERFQGTITDLGDMLVINLSFGDEPYVLELKQGSHLRFISLVGSHDTISKAQLLSQGLDGDYSLSIRDFFSRRVSFADKPPLQLDQPLRPALWMWLIVPLLIMVAYLLYRNLSGSQTSITGYPKSRKSTA